MTPSGNTYTVQREWGHWWVPYDAIPGVRRCVLCGRMEGQCNDAVNCRVSA